MGINRKYLEEVTELQEKSKSDATAKKQWEKLLKQYNQAHSAQVHDIKDKGLTALLEKLASLLEKREGDQGGPDGQPCGGAEEAVDRQGMSGRPGQILRGPSDDSTRMYLVDVRALSDRTIRLDLELLADKVMTRLMFEVRIERERAG
jgi:hypothetical protein